MIISGLQELSLIDYPGEIASIIFTQGCPLRCGYCHNPELLPVNGATVSIPVSNILKTLEKNRTIVSAVVVTGGEPTVHNDLEEFLKELRNLQLKIKLDTNGVHPERVRNIVNSGLVDVVAMDIKHTWKHYEEIVGRTGTTIAKNCRETLVFLLQAPITFEARTTIQPGLHHYEDIEVIAENLTSPCMYTLQRVRFQKTLGNLANPHIDIPLDKWRQQLAKKMPHLTINVKV